MSELLRYLANRTTIPVYFLGTLCVVAGTYLTHPDSRSAAILEGVGFTVIVTTLVATSLNFRFQKAIHAAFTIVKQGERASIETLYAKRKFAIEEIGIEATKAKNRLDVLTISGTDFFMTRCYLLRLISKLCQNDTALEVRVLLLDPRSRYAVERSLREDSQPIPPPSEYDYYDSTLCEQTLAALKNLETVIGDAERRKARGFRLRVRLYNSAPMLMCLMIDDRLFVENYHLGIPPEQIDSRLSRCLGKAVPIIESSGDTRLGRLYHSHFEYLWQLSATRELTPGCYRRLRSSAEDETWLQHFLDVTEAEDKMLALSLCKPETTAELAKEAKAAEPSEV